MGPTGAGKTALAIDLYERGGFELVSVDSAQVYRRMDIGTAKPDPATLARAPHRLLDIREPWETYSAAEFAADAASQIGEITARGHTPVLVGGTMLYFRALIDGLAMLPDADPEVRAALEREAERKGWPALHDELARVDPAAAARIHRHDPQRIQRALEVFRITGEPLSTLQAGKSGGFSGNFLRLAVSPRERRVLHGQINNRFAAMLRLGFLDEVKALMSDPRLTAETPAMRAVGYRHAISHLAGHGSLDDLEARACAATRQLAKRQLTWLRHLDDVSWLDPTEKSWKSAARSQIARFLHTPVC
ncbi:MAG: tRNA (adenosine(37)-N6)-dimethylallyltransferase MiaA [Pseudomonadota bacterium]